MCSNKLTKAFPGLVARVKQLVAEAGLTVEVKEDCPDPTYYDPRIELGDSGIGVSLAETARVWLKNEKDGTQLVVTYQAFATTYDPGVMYHSDGSGTPPSEDYVELGEESSNADQPIVEAIKAYVESRLNQLFDHEADVAMEREMAEAEAFADELNRRDC